MAADLDVLPADHPLDDIDPHGGLFGRRSVLGGLAILALVTFFGVGLQAIDDGVRRADGFSVGAAVEIAPGATFTPSEGWINDPEQTVPGSAVVAHKNGWQIKLAGGLELPEGQTIEDWAALFADTDDPSVQVTDPVTFTTNSGLTGVTFEKHGPSVVNASWFVTDGSHLVQMLADGSAGNLDTVEAELQQMAESITIDGSGR